MTVVERGIIFVLFHLEYTIAMISKISGRAWATGENVLNRTAGQRYIENAPGPGGPKKAAQARWEG